MQRIGFFSNPRLLLAWSFTMGFPVAVVYVPSLQNGFDTVPPAPIPRLSLFVPAVLLSTAHESLRRRGIREGAR